LLLGALAALGAAFFSASLAISMKKLCNQNVHFAISTIYASYVGVPFNLALCLFSYSTQIESSRDEAYYKDANTIMWQVGYVLAAAVCSLTSVVLSNIAMSYEDASKVMIIKTGEIFVTFLMQTIFLDIVANHFSIVGSLLIFCATLSVLLYKMIEEKYNRQAPEMIVNEKRVTFEQAEKPKWKKILFYKI
jgi:drug/metabolite transporter (DMT)-like permease